MAKSLQNKLKLPLCERVTVTVQASVFFNFEKLGFLFHGSWLRNKVKSCNPCLAYMGVSTTELSQTFFSVNLHKDRAEQFFVYKSLSEYSADSAIVILNYNIFVNHRVMIASLHNDYGRVPCFRGNWGALKT